MTSRSNVRRRGRELAVAVLCHLESYRDDERATAVDIVFGDPPRGDEYGEDAFAALVADPELRAAARTLIDLFESRRVRLDAVIEATSKRWRLERMDRVDRNVIRLAAVELEAVRDTPRAVVVSEAVRLASLYGNERSAPFVNGLVEALARSLRDEAGEGASNVGPSSGQEDA